MGGHHFIAVVEEIQARKEAENSLRKLRIELEQKVEARTEALREANGRLLTAMTEQLESERQAARPQAGTAHGDQQRRPTPTSAWTTPV